MNPTVLGHFDLRIATQDETKKGGHCYTVAKKRWSVRDNQTRFDLCFAISKRYVSVLPD